MKASGTDGKAGNILNKLAAETAFGGEQSGEETLKAISQERDKPSPLA